MPMPAPTAVQEKAHRLEQLLLRIEGGEALAEVCAELEVEIDEKRLSELQGKYEKGGRSWQTLLDGRYGHPQKANSAIREWLSDRKREDESLSARQLSEEVKTRWGVELSVGHINYLLRKVELTGSVGRPRLQKPLEEDKAGSSWSESLDNGGIFFSGRSQRSNGD
jgi:transposase